MTQKIVFEGIETNNLKNISVDILKNKITAIAGVSGGGKSSLAYGTIHAVCHQSFKSIETGYFEDASYEVSNYSGIIPSVGIKQNNLNTNPRSTIYSYLNMASMLASVKNERITNIPFNRLKLNNPFNECHECKGGGLQFTPSIDLIIDREKTIKENPIRPWSSKTSNKGEKLLLAVCEKQGIDTNKYFFDLPKKQQDFLLKATSKETYSLSFKVNGKSRKRDVPFVGVIREVEQFLSSRAQMEVSLAKKFCISTACKLCKGTRLDANSYDDFYVGQISFLDFISDDVDSVLRKFKRTRESSPAFDRLKGLLVGISDIGLGYLSLSRSIPSLSGGELQKLNFSQLVVSDISNILIVVDEISSQIHFSDYKRILNGIREINSRKNTILLVEHCSDFINESDIVIEVGPSPGQKGGYIIGPYESWKPTSELLRRAGDNFEKYCISGISKNNVHRVDIELPVGGTIGIVGKSGAGKSSIAKYISENYKNSEYVSQGGISNNVRSTVASYLDVNKLIIKLFSEAFDEDPGIFSHASGSRGACPACDGKGVVRHERSFEVSIDTPCDLCSGRLFSDESNSFKLDSVTISELYSVELSELPIFLDCLPRKLLKLVDIANNLGLSHLSLNRKTSTLSGGEQKRLKLLSSYLKSVKNKILIIDEPGSGLDDWTATRVTGYIDSQKHRYLSTIIIDHKPSVFLNLDWLVEIGPGPGADGGRVVFEGAPTDYYKRKIINLK